MKKLILLIFIIPFLTGCYNYREINDLAIATAVSVEKVDNKFKLSVQIINPKKEQDTSSSDEPDFLVYSRVSDSIQECFRDIVTSSPKKIYGAHLELMIIDENLAKEDISQVLDFMFRDPEVRNEYYLVIGKNNNILHTITPLENISSQKINDSLKATSNILGTSYLITFSDFMGDYLSKKKELVLPSIEKIDSEDSDDKDILEKANAKSDIYVSDMGIFKANKLIGYLSKGEAIAYNFMMGNLKDTIFNSKYNNGYIINEIISSKTNKSIDIKNNKFIINISGKALIKEITVNMDLRNMQNIKKIENILNSDIEKLITDSFYNINSKFNSDVYGLRDMYYKKKPKYYNNIKNTWYEEIFPEIKIEVNSDIVIEEKGNLIGGIYE